MNNENRFYVLANGIICRIPDDTPATYLIDNHHILSLMDPTVLPGSIAYYPNKARTWQKSVGGVWLEDEGGYFYAPDDFTVQPAAPETDFWGTTAAALQSEVFVGNGFIHGTLAELENGQLVTDWGAGYFLALQFGGNAFDTAKHIYVGLNPSLSSGLVDVINDPDRNGVFKITDKDQNFRVIIDYGEYQCVYEYALNELKLVSDDTSEPVA